MAISCFDTYDFGLGRRRWSYIHICYRALRDNVADIYVGDYHITSGNVRQLSGMRYSNLYLFGKRWSVESFKLIVVAMGRCLLLNYDSPNFESRFCSSQIVEHVEFPSNGWERKFVTKYKQLIAPGNHIISQQINEPTTDIVSSVQMKRCQFCRRRRCQGSEWGTKQNCLPGHLIRASRFAHSKIANCPLNDTERSSKRNRKLKVHNQSHRYLLASLEYHTAPI